MRHVWIGTGLLLAALTLSAPYAHAQQFNSDNYLSKPVGVATLIVTYGERNATIMNTFSLLPRWEFTFAGFLYDSDNNPRTDDGYSTTLYAKYMFYENAAKTGGFAVKFGTGLDPGYLDADNRLNDAFRTYWTNAPITIPFLDNHLSLDVMPGASVTFDYGPDNTEAWAFTYCTRLAWSPKSPNPPTWSIVAEIVGAEGEGTAPAEYRIGPRWEPSTSMVFALTYDQEFKNEQNGAGFEIGMMLFTPPFFRIGGDQTSKSRK